LAAAIKLAVIIIIIIIVGSRRCDTGLPSPLPPGCAASASDTLHDGHLTDTDIHFPDSLVSSL